ncbi:MAG: hypothetical protein B5M51_02695 [Anaerolinea sp. 4484_236]|nr:MAG: hypothetical protein B5M51_02695 [Anaerolinea sp. 4484_236]
MTAHEDDEPLSVLTKIDFKNLESIEANKADAVITMLSDDENYRLCELFYEHYGTKTLVTRLHNPANRERFLKLGVLIVYPGTATARLLDQYARKPDSASLLLDSESKHQIREISVRDPNLHGIALRDLRLPSDTLIIAIHRGSNDIISHGYTRLRLGDRVTVIGSPQNLEEITLKLEV